MQKVCGNIFEDHKRRKVQLNLNIHWRFSQIFMLYNIGIGRSFSKHQNVSIQSEFLLLSI